MKLERITLQNFRQYYGKQRLEFAKDPERNVTVIHGVNGAGKTSLFLSINWCLYGKKVDDVQVIDNVGELMSKEAVRLAKPGETIETSVDLTFTHNGGRYLVRRTLVGKKQEDGTVELDSSDDLVVMRIQPDGQAERVSNPIGTISSILPANVREYFLFDGEKIDNFAKPEAASQVRDAIYLVLNIEILERAQRHLEYLAGEYRRNLKQVSSAELRKLVEEDEGLRAMRTSQEARMAEVEREIQSAEAKIADIDERLRTLEHAKGLQERRDVLDTELRERRQELQKKIVEIQGIATSGYIALADSAVESALQVLEEKREKGEIPSGIRQQFVQDLLEQMVCICGRPIGDGSPEFQRLRHLLTRSMSSVLEDDILNLNALLRTFCDRKAEVTARIDSAMKDRTQLLEIIADREGQLDDLSRQLKDSPLEEISRLEKRRREFAANINDYKMDIGSLATKIEHATEKIKDLEKQISKARKEKRKERLLSIKLQLSQKAADAIDEMHHTFADEMRKRIEEKTKEIFRKLVWKESHFSDVQLSPDFHLEVIDRYGRPARPELSAGERQVLSLSFIAAMAQISDEEAPLVMDTPFGRLSSHHRNSITDSLPKLADQLVLFVTDEELRDQAQANLQPYIGAEYRLSFDRTTSCTKIEEI